MKNSKPYTPTKKLTKRLRHSPVRWSALVVPPDAIPRYKRLVLPCGAGVTVTGDISEKTLAALDEMARTAMREVTAQPKRHNAADQRPATKRL